MPSETGKIRYVLKIKVYDINVDMQHLDKNRYYDLKNGIELSVSNKSPVNRVFSIFSLIYPKGPISFEASSVTKFAS